MTYSLSNNCTKNYYNRTLTVQVIVEDVVTWIFLRHSEAGADITRAMVSIRRPFDCNLTASRPLHDLRHDRAPTGAWAAALRPK